MMMMTMKMMMRISKTFVKSLISMISQKTDYFLGKNVLSILRVQFELEHLREDENSFHFVLLTLKPS